MDCSLIAFDLDGTMLNDLKQVPDENIKALYAAAEKGIIVVPTSGRLYPFIPEAIRELPFVRYCIVNNGGAVYDAREDRIIYQAEIPLETALSIVDYLAANGMVYDCYTENQGYIQDEMLDELGNIFTGPVLANMYSTYIIYTRHRVKNLRTFLETNGKSVQKIQAYFKDRDFRIQQLEAINTLFRDVVATSSLPVNIEINSSRATKGQALDALCRELGISLKHVAAFGDGLNDKDMLETSGISVVMCNGCDEVKSVARHISLYDNNDGGVGKALRSLGIV